MDLLRAYLLLGMVFHKVVWEFMKRRDGRTGAVTKQKEQSLLKSGVKLGKVLVLTFLVIQTFLPTIFPISRQPLTLQVTGTVIYSLGLAIAVIGRIQLGKNWVNLEDYRVLTDQKLVQSGIYRYIRHPIYIGDTLLVLGLQLALNSWLVLMVFALIPIIVRQALEEEAILHEAFPEYGSYRERTKMFIPFLI